MASVGLAPEQISVHFSVNTRYMLCLTDALMSLRSIQLPPALPFLQKRAQRIGINNIIAITGKNRKLLIMSHSAPNGFSQPADM